MLHCFPDRGLCFTDVVHAATPCGLNGFRCCGEGDGEAEPCPQNDNQICISGTCVTCGNAGTPCCEGNICNELSLNLRFVTAACNENGLCEESCGARGLPCCTEESEDASFYDYERGGVVDDGCGGRSRSQCSAGVCTGCGNPGEPCCTLLGGCFAISSECDEATGTCSAQTCGSLGLPCCDDRPFECESFTREGLRCISGMCKASDSSCGFAGGPCCTDSPSGVGTCEVGRCNDDNTCETRAALPPPAPPGPGLVPSSTVPADAPDLEGAVRYSGTLCCVVVPATHDNCAITR